MVARVADHRAAVHRPLFLRGRIAPDPVNFTRVLEAALPVVTHHFTKRLFDDCWTRSPNTEVYERRVPDFAATYRPDPLGRTTELRDELSVASGTRDIKDQWGDDDLGEGEVEGGWGGGEEAEGGGAAAAAEGVTGDGVLGGNATAGDAEVNATAQRLRLRYRWKYFGSHDARSREDWFVGTAGQRAQYEHREGARRERWAAEEAKDARERKAARTAREEAKAAAEAAGQKYVDAEEEANKSLFDDGEDTDPMWSLRKHDSRSRGILKGKWKMDNWEHFYDAGLTPNIIYNLNKLLDNYLGHFHISGHFYYPPGSARRTVPARAGPY